MVLDIRLSLYAGLILNGVRRVRRTDHPSKATLSEGNFYFGAELFRFLSIAEFSSAASQHVARRIA
jgi:hypothetical protein